MNENPQEEHQASKHHFRLFRGIELGDNWLFFIYLIFLLISALFVSSADTRANFSMGYMKLILISATICLAVIQVPTSWFANQKYLFRSVIILFVVGLYTSLAGAEINGARRWIYLGITTIQPSEFLKVLIIMLGALAGVEHKLIKSNGGGRYWHWSGVAVVRNLLMRKDGSPRFVFGRYKIENKDFNLMNLYWIGCLLILGVFAFHNLSMIAIYIPLMWLYPFLFDLKFNTIKKYIRKQFITGIIVSIVGGALLALFLSTNILEEKTKEKLYDKSMGRIPTAISRLTSATESDKIDYKHLEQKDYGIIALCRNPLTAPKPGSSLLRSKLAQSESDYILSFIIEEYGITALFALILLYAVFIGRLFFLAKEYSDEAVPLMRYLFHGFILLLLIELSIHLVVNANLVVTGQSLPFISKGGSSLLAHSLLLGILLNICRQAKAKKKREALNKQRA